MSIVLFLEYYKINKHFKNQKLKFCFFFIFALTFNYRIKFTGNSKSIDIKNFTHTNALIKFLLLKYVKQNK